MKDFPGNSQRAKVRSEVPKSEEGPKVERITTAVADQRKRGLGQKFKGAFINGSARDTADYIVTDVVIPAIRDTLFEAFEGGLHRLIYGDSTRTRRSTAPSAYSNVGRVDYSSISRPPAPAQAPRMLSRRARHQQDFGEIIIESRREAEEVLDQMYECLSRFGEVSVADLYIMTGIASSHVDHKWGWTSLQGAKLVRRGQRFLLDLPEPQDLT